MTNLEKILAQVKENGGDTVHAESQTLKIVNLTVGHAVAMTNFKTTIDNDAVINFKTTIDNYAVINLIIRHLKSRHYSYIGFWLDGQDLYIDGVEVIMLRNLALELAKTHKQKAIWDFMNEREVFV